MAVQTPGLWMLLARHAASREAGTSMYGLIFALILLHAAHVVGGIVARGAVTAAAGRGRYDHESYAPVKHAALYWHFWDGVWLVMFGVMFVMG